MAKNKTKKLPKQLGGMKIPKDVRRGAVGDFLASPAGQRMLAEGLLILGAAVLGHEARPGSTTRKALKASAEGVGKMGQATAEAGPDAPGRLSFAFNEAARAFREALQSGEPAKPAPSPAMAEEAEPDLPRKRRTPASPQYSTPH